MTEWELNVALGLLGLDDGQKQTVIAAIPIWLKMAQHVKDNKALFATLIADGKLTTDAAQIMLNALMEKLNG